MKNIVAYSLWVVVFTACATPAPKQLVDARTEYERVSRGPARTLAPVQLHEAEKALVVANNQFAEDPHSEDVVDLAYVAKRNAQVADVQARAELSRRQQQQAAESLHAYLDSQQTTALRRELAQTKESLSAHQAALAKAQAELAQKLSSLPTPLPVHQEARGLVITLPSSLLFAFGKADLLPNAREKLWDLSDALRHMPKQKIRIEGHTDAVGSNTYNEMLSYHRAEAVREFLASRGVSPDQMVAVGFGKNRPVADNSTPEGRADNRRVEIVLPRPPVQENAQAIGGSGQSN